MSAPLQVLHVHAGNIFGGIERVLDTFARTENAMATHHFALAFDGRCARMLGKDRVTIIGAARLSRPWSQWRPRRRLRTLLAARHPDVLLFHAPWAQAIFGSVTRPPHCRLARWHQGAQPPTDRLERLAARHRPDLAICNSEFTKRTAATAYGSVPVTVVYPPVTGLPRDAAQRAAARDALGVDPETTVLLAVSRIEEGKGHVELVRALARLETDRAWTCWIVGGPGGADGTRYLAAVREAVSVAHLEDRVEFLGEPDDVTALFAGADVFCQANTAPDAFGVSFVEALSAGLPVVTTAMGGALEVVDDTCGILVPPSDPSAFGEALASLVADRHRRARLSAAGPARARQIADPAGQEARLVEALRTVVS